MTIQPEIKNNFSTQSKGKDNIASNQVVVILFYVLQLNIDKEERFSLQKLNWKAKYLRMK